MTGYIGCCCEPIGFQAGYTITTSANCKWSFIQIEGGETTIDNHFEVSLDASYRSLTKETFNPDGTRLEIRRVDQGSEASGFFRERGLNQAWSTYEVLGFTDLNANTGETYSTGDPILRIVNSVSGTSNFGWPIRFLSQFDSAHCFDEDPQSLAILTKTVTAYDYQNPNDERLGATCPNRFTNGDTGETSVFNFRAAPIDPAVAPGVWWPISGMGPIKFRSGYETRAIYKLRDGLDSYGDENDLEKLGLDCTYTVLNRSEFLDSNIITDFSLQFDGVPAGRDAVANDSEDFECGMRTSPSVFMIVERTTQPFSWMTRIERYEQAITRNSTLESFNLIFP